MKTKDIALLAVIGSGLALGGASPVWLPVYLVASACIGAYLGYKG